MLVGWHTSIGTIRMERLMEDTPLALWCLMIESFLLMVCMLTDSLVVDVTKTHELGTCSSNESCPLDSMA